MDPLGNALHLLRMKSVFYTRSEFSAPWGLALPALPGCMMFHMVTHGRCELVFDTATLVLEPGDFTLVPHGEGHVVRSDAAALPIALFDLPREQVSERYEILRHGDGGAATTMICGAVRFAHPAASHLGKLLPAVVKIELEQSPQRAWIEGLLQLMAAEAQSLQPGGETVVTRLADVLIVYCLRTWIAANRHASGWLGALQDRQIGRALQQLHRNPEQRWSVASLAAAAAMSRSAFAARFRELVGMSPMEYVTQWRLQMAVAYLQSDGMTVAQTAPLLGYESEAAFSRVFKRVIGLSPGAVRRQTVGKAI